MIGRIAVGAREPRSVQLRRIAVLAWIVLAAAFVAVSGLSLDALVDAVGCAVLVAVTVTDLERRIIPNRIVVPALVAALVVQTARDPGLEWVLSAAGAGGLFLVLALVYPAGLGMGDVKLAAFMGAWLGAVVFVALFAGSLLAAIAAVVVLLRHGAAGRKVGIPFAPFLAAGGVAAVFAGQRVLDAWLG
jgi:leader peptidase (prepilin peptidase)/N-methyltransferase